MMGADNRSIRAGNLHHKAELQIKIELEDGGGGIDIEWQKVRDLWCHIKDVTGDIALQAMQREEKITTEIFARYSDDITTGKRIVHCDKEYMIAAVLRGGLRKEFMQIIAIEGVAT